MSDTDTGTALMRPSVTDAMTLADVLSRLASCDLIDALAFYGPPASPTPPAPGSDYDLLALVTDRPHALSHIFTTIGGCTTDVLFVDTSTFDAVLSGQRRVATGTIDAIFFQKLPHAQVIVDRSQRLARWRQSTTTEIFRAPSYAHRYLVWFSQNFTLAQLKRLALSNDPVYRTTVRLLLGIALGRTCQAYFDLRQLPWEGEKRALQWLASHDPAWLGQLQRCLDEPKPLDEPSPFASRATLDDYESLVAQTIEPFGPVWPNAVLAASFVAPVTDPATVRSALDLWAGLFT
jgi:hypothetical protein